MADVRMGRGVLNEGECRRIEPLEIIDEDQQWMLRLCEHAHKALEYGLEAKLGIERRKMRQVRLGADHPYELRNQVREEATVGPNRLEDAVTPARDFVRLPIHDLADQCLECFSHSRVGDVAAALIKLSRDENATRKDDHLVQFVYHRRFADPGIA